MIMDIFIRAEGFWRFYKRREGRSEGEDEARIRIAAAYKYLVRKDISGG